MCRTSEPTLETRRTPMGAIVAMTGPPAAGALGWVIITRAVIASVPDHPSVTPRLGGVTPILPGVTSILPG